MKIEEAAAPIDVDIEMTNASSTSKATEGSTKSAAPNVRGRNNLLGPRSKLEHRRIRNIAFKNADRIKKLKAEHARALASHKHAAEEEKTAHTKAMADAKIEHTKALAACQQATEEALKEKLRNEIVAMLGSGRKALANRVEDETSKPADEEHGDVVMAEGDAAKGSSLNTTPSGIPSATSQAQVQPCAPAQQQPRTPASSPAISASNSPRTAYLLGPFQAHQPASPQPSSPDTDMLGKANSVCWSYFVTLEAEIGTHNFEIGRNAGEIKGGY